MVTSSNIEPRQVALYDPAHVDCQILAVCWGVERRSEVEKVGATAAAAADVAAAAAAGGGGGGGTIISESWLCRWW